MALRGPSQDFNPEDPQRLTDPTRSRERRGTASAIGITFGLMMIAWIVFSGRFDLFHLSLGVLSSLGVAFFSWRLIFPRGAGPATLAAWPRFIAYVPWLLGQIIKANWDILKVVLNPSMDRLIDPHLVKFNSRLKGDLPLVTLANSITLTPGTITVYVSINGLFTVHALTRRAGDPAGLLAMEEQVAKAFGQQLED